MDSHDNYTSAIPNGIVPDYVTACNHSALSGARLGIPRNVMALNVANATVPMFEEFERALGVLRAAGATIVENTNFTAADEFLNSSLPNTIVEADFVINLQTYLTSLTYNPNNITSLAGLREFTQSFPPEGYPLRDTRVWDQALLGWNNTDPRFWPAYLENLYFCDGGGLLGTLARDNLDAVLLPANFAANWASTVGAPIVTVPLGSYPADTPVVKNPWGLVEFAPNFP